MACRILLPDQRSNPGPWQRKCPVLTPAHKGILPRPTIQIQSSLLFNWTHTPSHCLPALLPSIRFQDNQGPLTPEPMKLLSPASPQPAQSACHSLLSNMMKVPSVHRSGSSAPCSLHAPCVVKPLFQDCEEKLSFPWWLFPDWLALLTLKSFL